MEIKWGIEDAAFNYILACGVLRKVSAIKLVVDVVSCQCLLFWVPLSKIACFPSSVSTHVTQPVTTVLALSPWVVMGMFDEDTFVNCINITYKVPIKYASPPVFEVATNSWLQFRRISPGDILLQSDALTQPYLCVMSVDWLGGCSCWVI